MKKLSFLFLALSFLMISCGDDDTMTPDPVDCDVLAEALVGTWNITNLGGESGQITLQEDGTLVDDSGVIIEYENNGNVGDIKTWSLDGNDLTFRAEVDPSVGSGFGSTTLTVTSFDCDQVTLDLGGIATLTMTK